MDINWQIVCLFFLIQKFSTKIGEQIQFPLNPLLYFNSK
jgi:hypothetical protein